MPAAVLLDLDDTLLGNRAAETAMLEAVGSDIAGELPGFEPAAFLPRYFTTRERHYVGVLRGETDVDGYRRAHLIDALAPWGVPSPALLAHVGELRTALPARLRPAAGAFELLRGLRDRGLRLGLLTNGPSELQREKVARAGFGEHLDAIGVSEELGAAKPDRAAFAGAVTLLGVPAEQTVMVGDNLDNDVRGALGAGLAGAIWVRVDGLDRREPPSGVAVVDGLAGVLDALDT